MEETTADNISEDRLTQECYLWFHNKYPNLRGLLFHVPNGGRRLGREAQRFKSMGVWSGVSDFLFIYNGYIAGIELKTKDGRISDEQREWNNQFVMKGGGSYYIVRSLEEFKDIINNIITRINSEG